ncbi:MAG TPA: YdeI/OmpD-associated family protein [Thermoanaerobaculia bacterium]|nr:YdeI/OmpD-associated family protein [Thermoanaerobaculia bacterium]
MPRSKLVFQATLGRITQNRCVDVPAEISAALGGGGRIAVSASVLGTSFESTLVSRGGGMHRLFIPSQVWRAHGLETGDRFPVELRIALAPEAIVLPDDLSAVAPDDPSIAEAYARITPADRRQIAKYLDSARTAETRAWRAIEMVKRLRAHLK